MKLLWGLLLFSVINAQSVNLTKHSYATLGTDTYLSASTSTGDIDNDGDIDIVVANGRHWSQFNQIFFNDGSGFFRRSKVLGDEANTSYMVPLADIDNDGDLDIVSVGKDNSSRIIESNVNELGQLHISSSGFGKFTGNPLLIKLIDLDQDGKLDFITTLREDDIVWYKNNGRSGGSWVVDGPYYIAENTDLDAPRHFQVIDIDNDNDLDLVAQSGGSGDHILLAWYENKDLSFTEHIILKGDQSVNGVEAGDIDKDGDIDIFSFINNQQDLVQFENDSSHHIYREENPCQGKRIPKYSFVLLIHIRSSS